jgi:hypothetical protein
LSWCSDGKARHLGSCPMIHPSFIDKVRG